MIKVGMSPMEVLRARADVLGQLSFNDQEHLYREVDASPRMAMHIAEILQYPDPIGAFNLSALQASLNELDPREYPQTAGLWPLLRREVEQLPDAVARAVHEATKDLTLAQKIVIAHGLEDGTVELGLHGIEGIQGTGLGWVGAVLGAAVQVTGGLIGAKITGDIQADIAEDQANLQFRLGQEKIAADKEMAEKRLLVEAALRERELEAATAVEVKKTEAATVAGLPAWLIPVVLLGGGLLVWLFVRFK